MEPPICDEECSDIDDSCSDGSYDSDIIPSDEDNENTDKTIKNGMNRHSKKTTISFNGKGYNNSVSEYKNPFVIWDPRQSVQNPIYHALRIKLYCRTGFHLAIIPPGRVRGFPGNTNDPHACFIVCPVSFGVIRIQSTETRHYLALNSKGYLYGEKKAKDNTTWEQWHIGTYDAFRSHKYANYGWWLGTKKNGRPKCGTKTDWGQKCIQFLPVQSNVI